MATFQSSGGAAAVLAENTAGGFGVVGVCDSGKAVEGRTDTGTAIVGMATNGTGVIGLADNGFGVVGVSGVGKAVEGRTDTGTAIIGMAGSGGRAGFFQGDVQVTGDLILLGADVAEQFDVAVQVDNADQVGPGTVVVLDEHGALAECSRVYDTRVAGVVSGAGDRVPALVLDRHGGNASDGALRRAVAVVGKAWCRGDASSRPIQVGDLLTTSSTPGHAMAAVDRDASFGAVLGKALSPLASGTGLVLVLVGLG